MGAARRAERNEIGATRPTEQDITPSAPPPQPPSSEASRASVSPSHKDMEAGDPDVAPRPAPKFDRRIRPARPNIAIDPDHAARFGPYASVYRPEPEFTPPQAPRVKRPAPKPDPEADVTVRAANSNTGEAAPSSPPPLSATVVAIPRQVQPRNREEAETSRRSEPRAHVTLQRETATFTVPVSEAVMPDSLKAAMRAFNGHPADISGDHDAVSKPRPMQVIQAEDPLSDDDRAFIRRIAPPAAE